MTASSSLKRRGRQIRATSEYIVYVVLHLRIKSGFEHDHPKHYDRSITQVGGASELKTEM
jgi:hypothetical protein